MGRGDSYQLQGLDGWVCIDDTTPTVGPFRWVTVINDAVIDVISTDSNCTNADGMTGITLPAGLSFGGEISDITLTSGVVLAYKL